MPDVPLRTRLGETRRLKEDQGRDRRIISCTSTYIDLNSKPDLDTTVNILLTYVSLPVVRQFITNKGISKYLRGARHYVCID